MKSDRALLLAELLKEMRKDSGEYFPDEVWLEVHKTFALPYVELIVPRKARGRWEIFLIRRPPTDKYWPSAWHLPGGLWRTGQTESQACRSVARREMGISVTHIEEVMTYKWTTHPYGNPISHVCVCHPNRRLRGAADKAYFAQLPKRFIPEQVRFVKEAIKYLRER